MNKKSLLIAVSCYLIWGVLPLYWHLLSSFDALFILAHRIVYAGLFCVLLLAARRELPALRQAFRRDKLRWLIPSALFITVNWGLYIYAVTHDRVLDASLGYFMNPLVTAVFGMIFYKERLTRGEGLAMALALCGVVWSAIAYGRLPLISLALAFSFAAYGVLKKRVAVDATAGITVETAVVALPALLYIIFPGQGPAGMAAITLPCLLLLMGGGIATAVPLILFARGVRDLPLTTMGFLQFISPTISAACGLLMGESMTPDRLICYIFILAALAVFMRQAVRRN